MKQEITRLVKFKYNWEDIVTALMDYADPDNDMVTIIDGARIIDFIYDDESRTGELLLEVES